MAEILRSMSDAITNIGPGVLGEGTQADEFDLIQMEPN